MDSGMITNAAREVGEQLASAAEDLASGPMGGLMGGFPDAPSVPGAPSLPDVPSAPEVPSVPDPSGFVPDAGGLMPDVPDVPQMPGAPADGAAAAAEERREWLRQQFGDDLGLEGSDPQSGAEERREWLRQQFGDDLGLEGSDPGVGDGYGDVKEEPAEDARPEAPAVSSDEEATAVVRVCREGWNTIDTRARGGHWFSA
jgi:hypothetical protein